MRFSLISILETTIFLTFIIIVLNINIFYKGRFLNINPGIVLFCIICIVIRGFLPYELFYTVTIKSEKVLPLILNGLNYSVLFGIPLSKILVFIWLTIAGIKIVLLIKRQIRLEKNICFFPNSEYSSLLQEVLYEKGVKKKIELKEIPSLSTPILIGLKNTRIVIPKGIPEKDVYYILMHEIEHYKHHDLYLIAALHLLCIIYWWNPVFYILKNTAQNFVEYRIDNAVCCTLNKDEKLNYLESILDVAKLRNRESLKFMFGLGFYEKQTNIARRFMLILESKEKGGRILANTFFIIVLLSTLIVIEPYSIKEEYSNNTYCIPEDSFFIKKDGAYELYLNGKYYITVDKIDGFEDIRLIDERSN